ncbi:flagellar basal-body MS-ring/collar protein FliF [Fonticella tunisiensis]|uniref:Flagellar M-ring protein n=1 Tax=Fonticella tunisiensis TaxID=1096341 RepID=A0A4R7KD32_9CLOT|nr:flagellar basal-body MS-ring/collar protein FliF [Fonticella tunisiensis]TDT50612.1 flagellar M-ring protein FliF [Fonticella tunisiensis]
MNKIRELLKSLNNKWKSLSSAKKIGLIVISAALLATIAVFFMYINRVKYATLFANLDPKDAARVYEKLKSDKADVKIEGNSILVPEDKVDELRMSVLSSDAVPSSGKGWELFDESKFGVTDTEAKVMYQRALEGELSRTISSFEQVEKAIVHLVLPDDSVFARETDNARASVTLKLKNSTRLTPEQVKAIVALISGSVKNLPKENVEVIDANTMVSLTEDLFDGANPSGITSITKQRDIERQFEGQIENNIKDLLGKVFGNDKLSVKVNTDLDFDSKQTTTITYDKNPVIISTHKSMQSSKDSASSNAGSSPIDNQYTPNITNGNNQSSDSSSTEETTNYNVGQTQETVVKAPGEVKRMTVSVLVDGNLSDEDKTTIQNIVSSAIGYDPNRGDQINIEGIPFNPELKQKVQDDLKKIQQEEENQRKIKLYTTIGSVSGGIILLILSLLFIRKSIKKKKEIVEKPNLDVVINDNVIPKQPIAYSPVLEDREEVMDIEKEIRQFASSKPDQVVDLIKTWLAEDER